MPVSGKKNILFLMFDQLRFDYLSCYGHPHLQTPNLDWLASQGVRFSNCYVQSPICGASRMSFYTGRYVSSHGAAWNGFPLKVGEMTLGDHLRAAGADAYLIGKTHMRADAKGMARLGLSPDSIIGAGSRNAVLMFLFVMTVCGVSARTGPMMNRSLPIINICIARAMKGKTRGMILRMQAWMQMGISPLAGYIITAICQPISARKILKRLGLRARR